MQPTESASTANRSAQHAALKGFSKRVDNILMFSLCLAEPTLRRNFPVTLYCPGSTEGRIRRAKAKGESILIRGSKGEGESILIPPPRATAKGESILFQRVEGRRQININTPRARAKGEPILIQRTKGEGESILMRQGRWRRANQF
jgi:hypothetical protein